MLTFQKTLLSNYVFIFREFIPVRAGVIHVNHIDLMLVRIFNANELVLYPKLL